LDVGTLLHRLINDIQPRKLAAQALSNDVTAFPGSINFKKTREYGTRLPPRISPNVWIFGRSVRGCMIGLDKLPILLFGMADACRLN
jgi:hypothetical protein